MSDQPSLLEPTLSESKKPAKPTYSNQAHFLVSFFGGPLAILVFFALGFYRMEKLKENILLTMVIGAISIALYLTNIYLLTSGYYVDLIDGFSPSTVMRRMNNILGVLTFGTLYLTHRHLFTMSENHHESASPWKAVLISILGVIPIQVTLYKVMGVM